MVKKETRNYDLIALDVEKWMRNNGYYFDPNSHNRRTVTVDEILREFNIDLDDDGIPTNKSYKEWQHIKLSMYQLGMPIAVCYKGHYIGLDGEQATGIARNMNTAIALLETCRNQMEAVKTSGKSEDVKDLLSVLVSQSRLETVFMGASDELMLLTDEREA